MPLDANTLTAGTQPTAHPQALQLELAEQAAQESRFAAQAVAWDVYERRRAAYFRAHPERQRPRIVCHGPLGTVAMAAPRNIAAEV